MNKFLSLLLSAIIPKFVNWLWEWWTRRARRRELKKQNRDIIDKLKEAKTKEERENAVRNLINNS